ncbi:glutamine-hydrolyzing GMP synthase [Candidatus Gracilibacteria bacterium]|nr:glutamine-hydrolyzing GMP synthase [Candidatus Gracilibacteria bacterium]MCF7818984.1 glutamine-hydrolyzing GMP synthase [Candidatus Gracilibacteria bacterium]
MHEKILILDFGGQYAHLIASRIRRMNVLAEIADPESIEISQIKKENIKGIILSGGPQSVFEPESPSCDKALFDLGIPILGICYGHQYITQALGGKVAPGHTGEFGRAELIHDKKCPLFENVPEKAVFWMNHVDEVGELAPGFVGCGSTTQCQHAAYWHPEKKIFSVQCHLEVSHSPYGNQVFKNFLEICGVSYDWTIEQFFEEEKKRLQSQVGNKNIFLFVSGGVDSSVAFGFLTKIFGPDRVKGLFVDTGLLRKNEVELVSKSLREIGADLTVLHEEDRFLEKLKGVADPEKKREIIGHAFLEVQHDFFTQHKLHDEWLLAQGTIYPDTIETGGTKHADKIKTHHNRAPEVQKLIDQGKIVEPLKELYKDEVRKLGEFLGLPHQLVWRHPFPGPGLGVRILCSDQKITESAAQDVNAFTLQKNRKPFVTLPVHSVGVQGDFRTYKHPAVLRLQSKNAPKDLEELEKLATKLINHYSEINRCLFLLDKNFSGDIRNISLNKKFVQKERVKTLQKADDIVTQTLHKMKVYDDVWQFPVVLIPVSFNNTGEESIVLRPIDSLDAMSASVGKLPWEFFGRVAAEILKDEKISAVFLDVTSKPPGTIEWE